MRFTASTVAIMGSALLFNWAAAEPRPVPVLADVQPGERALTFWNLDSSQALKDKESNLLSGGRCNVVLYLSSALKRAEAGKKKNWRMSLKPPTPTGGKPENPRSVSWFTPNALSPWCHDGGATTDTEWPANSIPFDSVLNPEEEDALLLVLGNLSDEKDVTEQGFPVPPTVKVGSVTLLYASDSTREKIEADFKDFETTLVSGFGGRISSPFSLGKGSSTGFETPGAKAWPSDYDLAVSY